MHIITHTLNIKTFIKQCNYQLYSDMYHIFTFKYHLVQVPSMIKWHAFTMYRVGKKLLDNYKASIRENHFCNMRKHFKCRDRWVIWTPSLPYICPDGFILPTSATCLLPVWGINTKPPLDHHTLKSKDLVSEEKRGDRTAAFAGRYCHNKHGPLYGHATVHRPVDRSWYDYYDHVAEALQRQWTRWTEGFCCEYG
jgi:hypothetical protein